MKGFALAFSILFLLLLTLFSLGLLAMAGGYYSSTRHLIDDQNARVACDQAAISLVNRHNLGAQNPRFFFDPQQWNGLAFAPFTFSDFAITGELKSAWSGAALNLLTISARRGPHLAQQQIQLAQRRFENFALYCDSRSVLPGDALVDGPVFSREPLELLEPGVEFRSLVQAEVTPETFATFHRRSLQQLPYPRISEVMNLAQFAALAKQKGLTIKQNDANFWKTDHFELDLDQLAPVRNKKLWDITYKGIRIATTSELVLYFDGPLTVRQSGFETSPLPAKQEAPMLIVSQSVMSISSSLHKLESASYRHPLALISGSATHVTSGIPKCASIDACVMALGWEDQGGTPISLMIEPGGSPTTETQKQALEKLIRTSLFILHPNILDETIQSIEDDEKIIWMRGGLVLDSGMFIPPDLRRLHLQAPGSIFSLLPALPFIYVMEGTQSWR